jgi:hypothetical protein
LFKDENLVQICKIQTKPEDNQSDHTHKHLNGRAVNRVGREDELIEVRKNSTRSEEEEIFIRWKSRKMTER